MVEQNDLHVAREQLRGAIETFRRAGVQTITPDDLSQRLADIGRIRSITIASSQALFTAARLLRAEGAITRRVLRRADPNFYEVTETTVLYDIEPDPKGNSRPS